jgi:hypothetical protein
MTRLDLLSFLLVLSSAAPSPNVLIPFLSESNHEVRIPGYVLPRRLDANAERACNMHGQLPLLITLPL